MSARLSVAIRVSALRWTGLRVSLFKIKQTTVRSVDARFDMPLSKATLVDRRCDRGRQLRCPFARTHKMAADKTVKADGNDVEAVSTADEEIYLVAQRRQQLRYMIEDGPTKPGHFPLDGGRYTKDR